MRTRWQRAAVLTLGAALFGLTAAGASANATPASLEQRAPSLFRAILHAVPIEEIGDDEVAVPAGTIDDGEELLPQAAITLDEAIAAAQGAATGPIGEVDLEYWNGPLVFNVDVGDADVKVDAATGEVLASETDD